jgi:hypothetical protein
MTAMFYFYEGTLAADALRDELDTMGVHLEISECLCETQITPDITSALIHPHSANYNKCYSKIKEQIITHPNIKFYIFAIGNTREPRRRIEMIGEHPNLEYLTEPDIKQYEKVANGIREAESLQNLKL